MNPLRSLRPALYAALASPPVALADGTVLPVRAYGNGSEPAYILLNPDQDTQNRTLAGNGCDVWDCTFLVDVVTLHQNGQLSVALADEAADAVAARLDQSRFALPGGLHLLRAVVENVNGGSQLDGEQVDIHRYLRLRYAVAYNGPAVVAAPGAGSTPGTAAPATYAYAFTNQASVTIPHNLGRFVLVQGYLADGTEFDPDVHTDSPNQITVTFSQPLTGTLVLQ